MKVEPFSKLLQHRVNESFFFWVVTYGRRIRVKEVFVGVFEHTIQVKEVFVSLFERTSRNESFFEELAENVRRIGRGIIIRVAANAFIVIEEVFEIIFGLS
jgi:hypothetical protein